MRELKLLKSMIMCAIIIGIYIACKPLVVDALVRPSVPTSGVDIALSNMLTNANTDSGVTYVMSSSVQSNNEPPLTLSMELLDVPSNNSFKSYMDADTITNVRTKQYELKSEYELLDNGLYVVNGRYCIAIGSYYTTIIGTRVDVVMKSGNVVGCIVAECKSDLHTDETNRQNPNGSVIEFVVNTSTLPQKARDTGNCSYADDNLLGEIERIIVYE